MFWKAKLVKVRADFPLFVRVTIFVEACVAEPITIPPKSTVCALAARYPAAANTVLLRRSV